MPRNLQRRDVGDRMMEFTPIISRLLARTGVGPATRGLTDEEIAERSGLSLTDVMSIQQQPSWDKVSGADMVLFHKGCGIVFHDGKRMHRHEEYLRKGMKFAYLRKTPEWMTRWNPMIQRQKAYYAE